MRIRVYLVRHAESLSNIGAHIEEKEDVLSDKGILQARKLASYFDNFSFEAIYTSQSFRAKLTAEETSNLTRVKSSSYDFLGEREGHLSDDLVFSTTEKFEVLKRRLTETKNFLENSKHKHVVVSHAIFIKALIAYLMFEDSLNESSLARISDIIVIENVGVIELVFNKEKERWRIISINNSVSSEDYV